MPPAPSRIRAVLFDLGGTLVDEREFSDWAELARKVQLDFTPDDLAHAYAEVERQMDAERTPLEREARILEFWRRTLESAAGRPASSDTARRFIGLVRTSDHFPELFSDVRRCLDALRSERRRLGVVSNSTSESVVRRILDRAGILRYFDPIVSSGTEGVEKPHAEIFARAVRRLGLAADEVLYVGNLPETDARAARAAGLHSLWLNREGTGLGTDPPEITSLLEVHLVLRRLERGD